MIRLVIVIFLSNSHVLALLSKYKDKYFYTSTADLAQLIHVETKFIHTLNSYIEQQESMVNMLKKHSEKVKENQKILSDQGIGKITDPISAFMTMHRIGRWLQEEENFKSALNNKAEDALHKIRENPEKSLGTLLPTKADLNGAAEALFRLQDTYNLEAKTMSNGQLAGTQYTERLSAKECLELGRIASSELSDPYHALIWFQEALRKALLEKTPTADMKEILEKLSTAFYRQGNPGHALLVNRHLISMDRKNKWARKSITLLEYELRHQGIDPETIRGPDDLFPLQNARLDDGHLEDRDGYEALCRGENQDQSEWSKLYCYYKRDTLYSRIAPFKIELLRIQEPRVILYRQIVTDHEVDMLKSLAEPKFHTTTSFLKYRVSKSAWVHDAENALVRSLSKRIEQVTGLSTQTAEHLHLSCYGIGGHYEPHFDYYRKEEEEQESYRHMFQTIGNRIATVLLYLSEPHVGGATVFTDIKLTLRPTKNDAVFWYSLHPNGTVDPRTRHAACPVVIGQKWIGNKWLHERGQEFHRPCSKDN